MVDRAIIVRINHASELVMRHPHLPEILTDVRQHLEHLYGDRLSSLLLYGSQARNEARHDSDIDLLVALHEPFDLMLEIDRTTPFIADLCLTWEVHISVNMVSDRTLQDGKMPFFLNLRREAISA
jgi:uncharacterized protein